MEEFLLKENNALRERLCVAEAHLKVERDANPNNMESNTYMLHLQIEATLLEVAQLKEENNTLHESLYVTEANLKMSNQAALLKAAQLEEENNTLRGMLSVTLAASNKLHEQLLAGFMSSS